MSRPDRLDAALLLGAVAASAGLVAASGSGAPELVFLGIMLSLLILVVRSLVEAMAMAWSQHRREAELAALRPDEVALEAVRDERHRLHLDIAAQLEETLGTIAVVAEEARAAADPRSDVRRIHRLTQEASAELRRQLGLLREPMPSAVADRTDGDSPGRRLARGHVVAACLVTALALVEAVTYTTTEDLDRGWASFALTGLAASVIVGRSVAPGRASLVVAVAYLLGGVTGQPVIGGFWFLFTVGGLLWSVTTRPADIRAALGAAVMVVAVAATTWTTDRENAVMTVGVMVVAVALALTVRLVRAREREAGQRAAAVQAELDRARLTAVTAERLVFARDIHDVVSHAVGVVAMQAGAAQVTWPDDPAAAARALDVITETCRATLAELARLRPGELAHPARTCEDLVALVERIRAAGTPVELVLPDPEGVGPDRWDVVYRVVQEALTNVVRHAPGSRAVVTVVRLPDPAIRVNVTDDGAGHDGLAQVAARGYGLVGLAERVRFAGGTLRTGAPAQGSGFVVEAVLATGTGQLAQQQPADRTVLGG